MSGFCQRSRVLTICRFRFNRKLFRGGALVTSVALIVAVSCALRIAAQTASTTEGAIVGVVSDASGAAVPGATVSLSGESLRAPKTATTDSAGLYRFPALSTGDYTLAVSASGMTTQTRRGI